jgi:hypothetical protein
MSTTIMEEQLLRALDADTDLAGRAVRAVPADPDGVAIEVGGARAGVWHWRSGVFVLTGDRNGTRIACETVAEAARYTREHLCPPPA